MILLLAFASLVFLFREPLLGAVRDVSAPTVRIARAERIVPGQAQAGDVSANGYVVANRIASLATVLSGRLVEVHAEDGDIVEAGAVVARIQFDDLEAQYEAAVRRAAVADRRHTN